MTIFNDRFFFDEDYFMTGFGLECQPDGEWENHLPWKFAVDPNGKFI